MHNLPSHPAIWIILVVGMIGSAALADACPDEFNYVELNVGSDEEGTVLRVKRNEDSLLDDAPSCRNEGQWNADADGLPIPVVPTIGYDPTAIASALNDVSITSISEATQELVAMNRSFHDTVATADGVEWTDGPGFFCVSLAYAFTETASCEIDNPFAGTAPALVSCEGGACTMPVMEGPGDLIIAASWEIAPVGSAHEEGQFAAAMAANIAGFVTEQIVD